MKFRSQVLGGGKKGRHHLEAKCGIAPQRVKMVKRGVVWVAASVTQSGVTGLCFSAFTCGVEWMVSMSITGLWDLRRQS